MVNIEKVGQYKIEQPLGVGAYGTVLRAQDTVLDRTVALKTLKLDGENLKGNLESLEEAQILAKLNHPNIVTLYEMFHFGGQTYLAMEYVEGTSLKDQLNNEPMPLDKVVDLAIQIADALKYAHSLGVVHADVKPGNIMIDKTGSPLLVDFGLSVLTAHAQDHATFTGDDIASEAIKGTLAYIAPEVISGAAAGKKSDIFSFGAVLYEMLAGKRAFSALSEAATISAVLSRTPENLAGFGLEIPDSLADLISRMLEKDSQNRPQDMAEVYELLKQQSAEHAVHSGPVPKSRKPVIGGVIAAALAAFVILFAGGNEYFKLDQPSVHTQIVDGLEALKSPGKKGALENAETAFQQVILQDPKNAAATAGHSLALLKRYAIDQSDPATLRQGRAAADLALSLDDHLSLAHAAKAWALEFEGELPGAQQRYERALTLDPNNYFALQGYGRLLKKTGNHIEAIKIFEMAIRQYPDESQFYVRLGEIHFQKGRYDEAAVSFSKSISLAPDNIFAYASLSAVYYAQDRIPEAITLIQQGLLVRPHPILYTNLGTYFFALGQYPQAANAFKRALDFEGNSDHYLMWANLADAYRWSAGSEEKANAAYRRALQILKNRLSPTNKQPQLYSRAALFSAKSGQFSEARNLLAEALSLAPNDISVLFRAATTSEIIGERASALTYLQQAITRGYPVSIVKNDPEFAKLRRDPRYYEIINHLP